MKRIRQNSDFDIGDSSLIPQNFSGCLKIRKYNNYSLHAACEKGNIECVSTLLRSIDSLLDLKNEYGYTPLHCAVVTGHYEIARLLLEKGANSLNVTNKYETVLHLAALNKHFKILKLFIESNDDSYFVNSKDLTGKTCLHYACVNGDVDSVKLIFSKKADILIRDAFYSSPLHMAAFYNRKKVVKILIGFGADVNAMDSVGYTPLHYAKNFNYLEISEILTQNGGFIYCEDISLKDLRMIRQEHENIIKKCYL